MRSASIFLLVCILSTKGYCQTSEKRFVFDKTDTVAFEGIIDSRFFFTPSVSDVRIADSLAEEYIKKHRDDYFWAEEISGYASYYRQYIGYLNGMNERIVFINAVCRKETDLAKYIIISKGGGSCFFSIKINLEKMEGFDLHVNAPL